MDSIWRPREPQIWPEFIPRRFKELEPKTSWLNLVLDSSGQDPVVKSHKKLEKKVYPVSAVIDKEIARLKLAWMGIRIDKLTKEQKKYLASWEMVT